VVVGPVEPGAGSLPAGGKDDGSSPTGSDNGKDVSVAARLPQAVREATQQRRRVTRRADMR
jgi:hypothetical protein